MLAKTEINLAENFPHLSRAPIVEAIIDFRARATVLWDAQTLATRLSKDLPDYPDQQTLHDFSQEITIPPVGEVPTTVTQELGWRLRLTSPKHRHVVLASRDGFSLGRLQPYASWKELGAEAMRLWAIFISVAQPVDIQRIGVRFINRIKLPKDGPFEMEDFISPAPQPPRELALPYTGFLHQDIFAVPEYPYVISLTKTIQPPSALIVDIDVSKPNPSDIRDDIINRSLDEMRWLKNKIFFGTITERVLEAHR